MAVIAIRNSSEFRCCRCSEPMSVSADRFTTIAYPCGVTYSYKTARMDEGNLVEGWPKRSPGLPVRWFQRSVAKIPRSCTVGRSGIAVKKGYFAALHPHD